MPDTHALLSPSSSERWIACPPSVRLSEKFDEKPSEYAAEGTVNTQQKVQRHTHFANTSSVRHSVTISRTSEKTSIITTRKWKAVQMSTVTIYLNF